MKNLLLLYDLLLTSYYVCKLSILYTISNFNLHICSLAGWVRDPRSKYNLLTMLSIVLFLRSYLFYDYIGIVFITHVHTHLYYSPSRSDTHHFTITLLNIYHHTIKYKSFLNHTIT